MEKLPPLRTKAFSLYEDLVFRVYRNEVVQVVLQVGDASVVDERVPLMEGE